MIYLVKILEMLELISFSPVVWQNVNMPVHWGKPSATENNQNQVLVETV